MTTSARARLSLVHALVAVAAAAAFTSTLRAWFVGDDFGLIEALYDKPALHFFTLFTGTWTDGNFGARPDELRPFVALSYQLDMWGGATNPLPYHLGNLAYHLVSCALVGLARVAARASLPAALFAGLFFAWHPSHSETVAWISGRADSIPTLFYLGALVAYGAWRREPRPAWYAIGLASALCAHFSKQSAITLPAVLVAYELLLEPAAGRTLLRRLRPVLPFAAITIGYLALRQVLFGNYVREQMWSLAMVRAFFRRQPAYVEALLAPAVVPAADLTRRGISLLFLAIAVSAAVVLIRWRARERSRAVDAIVLFGPVWYVLTIGPLAVTYFSPRHLYLASAGLAVAFAALADRLADGRGASVRAALVAAAALLLGADLVALRAHNRYWNDAAARSQAVSESVLRVAQSAPPGSLVVVDAIYRTRQAYVWAWALPFAVQPPFASEDLMKRVGVVGNHWTYCCPQDQWLADVRRQLATWSDPQPVFVVSQSPTGAAIATCSDRDAPGMRDALRQMSEARSPDDAQRHLQAALQAAAPALAREPR